MRLATFALACSMFGCKVPPALPEPPDAGSANAEPADDVGSPEDLYQRAVSLKDERPGEAIGLFKKAALLAPSDAPLQAKVKEQLAQFESGLRDRAREAYLLGLQLKDSSPNDAARNFEHAMNLTPRTDPIYEKAKAQLRTLKKR